MQEKKERVTATDVLYTGLYILCISSIYSLVSYYVCRQRRRRRHV